MSGTHDLWLFVLSGLLLNVTPGPDTLYIVGQSSRQGWRAGATAALGIGTGALVHVCAASLGLSAILAASATAFRLVKLIGAAYLVYVGLSLIFSKQPTPSHTGARFAPPVALRRIYMQGLFTNVLNPKVALFFLAFLPQFVSPQAQSKPLSLLFLGMVFDLNGTLWNLGVAWLSAKIGNRYARGATFKKWFDRCVGGLFVAIGIRLALAHDQPT